MIISLRQEIPQAIRRTRHLPNLGFETFKDFNLRRTQLQDLATPFN
jgi:hypothetical protein